jgi:hypothetical protein
LIGYVYFHLMQNLGHELLDVHKSSVHLPWHDEERSFICKTGQMTRYMPLRVRYSWLQTHVHMYTVHGGDSLTSNALLSYYTVSYEKAGKSWKFIAMNVYFVTCRVDGKKKQEPCR